jgi:O-antigen/teichoic acid export membrane protein
VALERNLDYKPLVIVELLDAVVYVGWAITTVELGWGVWGLATAVVVRAIVGTSVLAALSPVRIFRPRLIWDRLRPILGFGARFQAIGAINVARDQGFNFAIAALSTLTILGFWTLVYRVLQTLLVVLDGLWRVSFPAMSRLIAAGEDPKPIIERGIGAVAFGSGVFLATLAACAPALIPSVVGERWADAADILPAACLGLMIVAPVSVSVAGYLFALGDAGTPLRGAVLHTAAQFAVAFPLLPVLGGWAIGLGGLAAGIIEALVLGRAASGRSGAQIVAPLSVPLVAATAAGAGGWVLASSGEPTLWLAALSGALALGSYLAAVALFRPRLLLDCVRLFRRGLTRAPTPA